jgi:hypothetical protein
MVRAQRRRSHRLRSGPDIRRLRNGGGSTDGTRSARSSVHRRTRANGVPVRRRRARVRTRPAPRRRRTADMVDHTGQHCARPARLDLNCAQLGYSPWGALGVERDSRPERRLPWDPELDRPCLPPRAAQTSSLPLRLEAGALGCRSGALPSEQSRHSSPASRRHERSRRLSRSVDRPPEISAAPDDHRASAGVFDGPLLSGEAVNLQFQISRKSGAGNLCF